MQPESSATPAAEPVTGATARPARFVGLWVMLGGLVAGVIGWLGGESFYGAYQPVIAERPELDKMNPYQRSDMLSAETRAQIPTTESKNTALAYGVLGAALAGALGLAGGLARHSSRHGLVGACAGLIVGGAAGAGLPFAMVPVFYKYLDPEPSRVQALLPFLVHGGIWVPIGMAAGLALGVGLGNPRRIPAAIAGGLLGALVGTLLFEAANAVAFPLMRVLAPVPAEKLPRLLAHLFIAVFSALGIALAVRERGKPQPVSDLPG